DIESFARPITHLVMPKPLAILPIRDPIPPYSILGIVSVTQVIPHVVQLGVRQFNRLSATTRETLAKDKKNLLLWHITIRKSGTHILHNAGAVVIVDNRTKELSRGIFHIVVELSHGCHTPLGRGSRPGNSSGKSFGQLTMFSLMMRWASLPYLSSNQLPLLAACIPAWTALYTHSMRASLSSQRLLRTRYSHP